MTGVRVDKKIKKERKGTADREEEGRVGRVRRGWRSINHAAQSDCLAAVQAFLLLVFSFSLSL